MAAAKPKNDADEKDTEDGMLTFSAKDGPSVDQFKRLKISNLVKANQSNFDISKAICNFYDDLYNDTDTVCICTDADLGKPAVGAWGKDDFTRLENNMEGKWLFIYRASKHVDQSAFKTAVLKPDKFKQKVKEYADAFHKQPIQDTADALDKDFHGLCHIIRCPHKQFDVYCRYEPKFMVEMFKLPKKDIYVMAWRR